MNRSWNRNSNGSTGFVYFNQNSQKETTDFLAFQESSKQSHIYSPNRGNPKFHSSPRNFNSRNNFRHSGGLKQQFYSPNCKNTWHKQKQTNSSWHEKKQFHKKSAVPNPKMMSADGQRDMTLYYDPTCILNPWEELEKELFKQKDENKTTEIKNEEKTTMISSDSSKKDSSSEEESSSDEESSSSDQNCEQDETT